MRTQELKCFVSRNKSLTLGILFPDISNLFRKRYLGFALGSPAFVKSYVNGKVKEWSDELSKLCEFATSQPHAAFSVLIMDCLEDGFISPELFPIFLSHFPLWNKISVCISCPP